MAYGGSLSVKNGQSAAKEDKIETILDSRLNDYYVGSSEPKRVWKKI